MTQLPMLSFDSTNYNPDIGRQTLEKTNNLYRNYYELQERKTFLLTPHTEMTGVMSSHRWCFDLHRDKLFSILH